MNLSLQQAAAQLGKTERQVRYMIVQKSLPAKKRQGRWVIDSDDLPRTEKQQQAKARRARQLRGLLDEALEVPQDLPRRYSVLDLKAFQICLPLYRRASEELGDEHAATSELKRVLSLLTLGCHRYEKTGRQSGRAPSSCAPSPPAASRG